MRENLEKKVVGVIDEDAHLLEVISQGIEEAGYRAISENLKDLKLNPDRFINFLRVNNPHLIIFDIPMPYVENWQFAQVLRTSPEAMRFPFLYTTTSRNELKDLIKPQNEIELLKKPFDLDILMESINRIIRKG